MKSITIHNLEDSLESIIREKSRTQGTSLNRTIQSLLKQALGLSEKNPNNHRNDFLDLFGVWSRNDLDDFTRRTAEFDKIDITT
ncbi:MAG: hypothetical protein EPN93_07530 [Spirochaetes bacterium]|nr:MAG: hypothetical protein EPN93_07530 [Spirochaetota bacterium]